MSKSKAEWRMDALTRLRQMTREEKESAESAIIVELTQIEALIRADRLACFYPDAIEPDIRAYYAELLAEGKRLAFPKYNADTDSYDFCWVTDLADFYPGQFGMLEPGNSAPIVADTQASIEVWLVPGMCFDHFGNRIGRGKGVYDRILTGQPGIKIGMCFDLQMAIRLPADPWDVAMDVVVSNRSSLEVIF